MNPSLLQLDHYAFSEMSLLHLPIDDIELKNGYPSFDAATFTSNVEFQHMDQSAVPEDDAAPRFGVRLTLKAEPADAENPKFPYRFTFDVVGIFHGPNLPEDKREALIAVNGASLLYSAVREQVLSMSSRSTGPALLLPSVKFDQLARDMLEQREGNTPAKIESSRPERS